MTRQCVTGRRSATIEDISGETTAWHEHSNQGQRIVDWPFKVDDARLALNVNSAVLLLGQVCLSAATPDGDRPPPAVGAIRWDAWYGRNDVVKEVERSLGPKKFHLRLPFFAQVVSDAEVRIDGDTQESMNQEIAYAVEAGLNYRAFVDYWDDPVLTIALRRYREAADKRGLRYCFVEEGGRLDQHRAEAGPRLVRFFHFAAMIQPVPATAKFSDPDYYIWCGTMVRGDDGKCHLFMVYKAVGDKGKAPFGGPVLHCVATSDSPTGPFAKHPQPIFVKEGVHFAAEDPFIWSDGQQYWAIVKDNAGYFTGAGRSTAFWQSADGIDWKLAKHPLVATTEIVWEGGRTQKQNSLERPQLFFENGQPTVLLFATDTDKDREHSFNVRIPLHAR